MRTSKTANTKLTLTHEQETLLITLFARAKPGNPLFFDQMAQDILKRVDYDFARLSFGYRMAYRLFSALLKRAHRIVYYQL